MRLIGVKTIAAIQGIISIDIPEHIIPGFTVMNVIIFITDKKIVSGTPIKGVISILPIESVITLFPIEEVTFRTKSRITEGVVSSAAIYRVRARIRQNSIIPSISVDQVIIPNAGGAGIAVVVVNQIPFRITSVMAVNNIIARRPFDDVVQNPTDGTMKRHIVVISHLRDHCN